MRGPLVPRSSFATWSGIVKYAWYFERLRTWMSTDIVAFSFWKKDGTIREAHGTLNSALIPEDKRPKGDSKPRKPNYLCFAYFDVDKQEWRSFTLDKFIGFVDIWRIEYVDKSVLKENGVPKQF